MKNIRNYIVEHIVNIFPERVESHELIDKYRNQVWNILLRTYAPIGGMAGMTSIDQLIAETSLWKLVCRGDKVTAVNTYSFKRGGRKLCYGGGDGTSQGKNDLFKLFTEDCNLKDRNTWAEASGAAFVTLLRHGGVPVRAEVFKQIMPDKGEIEIMPDGYFYKRVIGGNTYIKCLVGNIPNMDQSYMAPQEKIEELIELAKKYSFSES